jgi:hypothetical protein
LTLSGVANSLGIPDGKEGGVDLATHVGAKRGSSHVLAGEGLLQMQFAAQANVARKLHLF